jgi:hypothetical protein
MPEENDFLDFEMDFDVDDMRKAGLVPIAVSVEAEVTRINKEGPRPPDREYGRWVTFFTVKVDGTEYKNRLRAYWRLPSGNESTVEQKQEAMANLNKLLDFAAACGVTDLYSRVAEEGEEKARRLSTKDLYKRLLNSKVLLDITQQPAKGSFAASNMVGNFRPMIAIDGLEDL